MNEPLLSICIPTYRQPEAFQRLLHALVPQLTPEVEVVVRDDSPDEATAAIAARYQTQGVPLRLFRGERQGLDAAILFLTAEARGRYVWWFGDDLLESNGLMQVLAFLNRHQGASFVYVASRQTNDPRPAPGTAPIRMFRDGAAALEELSDMLGFITATILERSRATTGLKVARDYQGTAWVNLFLVLHVLAQPGEKYFFGEPLIVSEPRDPDTPSWYDGFTVFAINFLDILDSFAGSFPRWSLRHAASKNFHGIWRGIIVYRAEGRTHGLGARSVTVPVIARRYWSYVEFWFALPFLLIPRTVLTVLYRWYRTVRA